MPHNFFAGFFIILGTAVLLYLGQWQLDRLGWKHSILKDIESKISGTPQSLPYSINEIEHKYLPVEVSGKLDDNFLKIMVSQKFIGAGYRIIAPLKTINSLTILVDLGFVRHDFVSKIKLIENVDVVGNLHWPKEIDFFTPDPDKTNNIWYARDVDELSKHLGSEPILVIAKSFSPQIEYIDPLPITTLNIPNNHKQYAITWFSLAFIWLGMGAFFIYRTSASRGQKT